MTLLSAIPALPVSDIARAVDYYTDRFGFASTHSGDDYGIIRRDDVEIHLWAANKPGTAGAEPHIAGTASCRVRVSDVEALYAELQKAEVIHSNGAINDQSWGREFTAVDMDNNAITFVQAP